MRPPLGRTPSSPPVRPLGVSWASRGPSFLHPLPVDLAPLAPLSVEDRIRVGHLVVEPHGVARPCLADHLDPRAVALFALLALVCGLDLADDVHRVRPDSSGAHLVQREPVLSSHLHRTPRLWTWMAVPG